MAKLQVEMEIAAPPAQVRAVVLDFPNYKNWHTSFLKSIESKQPGQSGLSLQRGDKLHVEVSGATIEPSVTSNEPDEFSWYGSTNMGATAGRHFFRFEESKVTPGGTTFVHGEEYDGWMTFLFKPGWPLHKSAKEMYMQVARDLKTKFEGTPEEGSLNEGSQKEGSQKAGSQKEESQKARSPKRGSPER